MNLIEAIKSGKRFKRPKFEHPSLRDENKYPDGWVTPNHFNYIFAREDVLADDWEIEEEKIEITCNQLSKAWDKTIANYNLQYDDIKCSDLSGRFNRFKKELGFKENT